MTVEFPAVYFELIIDKNILSENLTFNLCLSIHTGYLLQP